MTSSQKRRRGWWRWLGSALALTALAWWASRQDWEALVSAVQQVSLGVVLGAWALYALGLVVNAWRWYVLLTGVGVRVPWPRAVKLTFAGSFASNFLPSTIGGDALRITGILGDAAAHEALASVIVDRALNVLAMYSFLPLTLLTYGGMFPSLTAERRNMAAALGFGKGWSAVRRHVLRFWEAFTLWMGAPRVLLAGVGIAWLSLIPPFTATWIVARGLGIPVAWYQVAGTTVISYTLSLLPVSVNGYGVREATLTGLYGLLGATPAQALALALLTRLLMWGSTLMGGLWVGEAVPHRE